MRKVMALVAFLAALAPLGARAQSNVTILLPEPFQVPAELATELRDAIIQAVQDHPSYDVLDLAPQTLSDMLMAVGCSDPNPECLSMVGEALGSDLLIWGQVGGSERAYLVDLTLWDLVAGRETYHYAKAVEGNVEDFRALLPTLGRGVVYGPVGELEITVDPADAAVEFDSRPGGSERPLRLTGLDLGPHNVRVTHPDYYEYSDTIIVDVQPATERIELQAFTETVEVRRERLWTWVALGTGAALIGTGVAFALITDDSQQTFDEEAQRVQLDLGHLQELQDEGETNALLTNVFLGAGGALVVLGIVLFFVEEEGESPAESSGEVSLVPAFGADRGGLMLDLDF